MNVAVHHAPDLATPALFGAGSLWWLAEALYQGLPPWNLVPPLLFGLAALVTAISNARKAKK